MDWVLLLIYGHEIYSCHLTEQQYMDVLFHDDEDQTKARAVLKLNKPWSTNKITGKFNGCVVVSHGRTK